MRALSVCRPYVFIVYRASMADSDALAALPGSTGGDVKVMTYQTDRRDAKLHGARHTAAAHHLRWASVDADDGGIACIACIACIIMGVSVVAATVV